MFKLQNTYPCPNKAVHATNLILNQNSNNSNKNYAKQEIFEKISQQNKMKLIRVMSDVTSSEDDVTTTDDDVTATNSDVSDKATQKRGFRCKSSDPKQDLGVTALVVNGANQ